MAGDYDLCRFARAVSTLQGYQFVRILNANDMVT
jgi:hypothetical protein